MPATCPDCAQPIQPAWRLCSHCGQPRKAVASLESMLSAREPNADRAAPHPKPGRSPIRWTLVSLLAIGILGLAILALPAVLGLAGIH